MAEFFGKNTRDALTQFRFDPACRAMSFMSDGSEGLDLSFVTHIYILDQIVDSARLQQLVARAWRLGAARSVRVVQVMAAGTVEEDLHNAVMRGGTLEAMATNEDPDEHSATALRKSLQAGQKAMLMNARLVRPPPPPPFGDLCGEV